MNTREYVYAYMYICVCEMCACVWIVFVCLKFCLLKTANGFRDSTLCDVLGTKSTMFHVASDAKQHYDF